MKKRRVLRAGAVFCLVLSILCVSSCADEKPFERDRTQYFFDTVIKVNVYDPFTAGYYRQAGRERPDLDGALDGVMALCRHYEDLFSRTKEGSDVWRINESGGKPVEVDAETAELLGTAAGFSEKTDGAFDVTVAPASSLWDFHAENPVLPDPAAVSAAVEKIGWRHILVEGTSVTAREGAQVDLGGVAKGYIADKAAAYLREQGVECFLLNFGGNVLCGGGKADQPADGPDGLGAYRIGVRKPFGGQTDKAATAEVRTGSVVTSGTYERYFELDGKRYHHILDPATGYPVENGLDSVTIFSESSTVGDILSTACFVLGPEAGMDLIESTEEVEALFILKGGETRRSGGLTADGEPGKIQVTDE